MQRAVAGQIDERDPGVGDHPPKQFGEGAPMACLTRPTPQEDPPVHTPRSRYQRCSAACRCCGRVDRIGTH